MKMSTRAVEPRAAAADFEDYKYPPVSPITAPNPDHIRCSDTSIIWGPYAYRNGVMERDDDGFREVKVRPVIFGEFLSLHKASDRVILSFAKKFGVLGLCRHGLPLSHFPMKTLRAVQVGQRRECIPKFTRRREIVEPLNSWRGLSRSAAALLQLQNQTSTRRDEERTRWRDALWLHEQLVLAGHRGYRSALRLGVPDPPERSERIARIANVWLECAGLRLQIQSIHTNEIGLVMTIPDTGPNLFGGLAIQLSLELANREGWAQCAACRRIFEPLTHNVSPTRDRFCPECRRRGKPELFAKRRYRARKRAAAQSA
jgi:hypothetical protein